jgi:hypothetical protein
MEVESSVPLFVLWVLPGAGFRSALAWWWEQNSSNMTCIYNGTARPTQEGCGKGEICSPPARVASGDVGEVNTPASTASGGTSEIRSLPAYHNRET